MFCCDECKALFEEPRQGHERHSHELVEPMQRCPECGSPYIREAEVCVRCGQQFPYRDGHHGLCIDCADALYRQVDNIIFGFEGDYMDAKEKFLEYMEWRWF